MEWRSSRNCKSLDPGKLPSSSFRRTLGTRKHTSLRAGWRQKTLSHPHLMSLLYTGRYQIDAAVLLYAVTEYAEDVLSEILPERPLTPSETKEMLAPVLDALSYLHGKGFVHGHLKPSNIMAVDNQVKLSGDSLQVTGEPGKRSLTLTVYDAPEVATETISPAGDVWSSASSWSSPDPTSAGLGQINK